MNKSIFISLIKKLSTGEQRKFGEYIASPFFNKRENLRQLYGLIIKTAPNYKAARLEKRLIFSTLFPKEKYNELKINNLVSNLLALLYDFLSYQQFQKNKTLQKQLLVKELLEREIHDPIDRIARSYHKIQSDSPIRNYEFYHSVYEINDKLDQHFLTKGIRAFDKHLQQKSDALDLYYIANKLRIAVDMNSRSFVSKSGYNCFLLTELLQIYERNDFNIQAQPAVSIYYKTLQMLKASQQEKGNKESEVFYQELKKLLADNLSLFPHEELRVIYLYLQNYCIYQINSGQSKYYQEILDLYKFLLENKIIFKNGFLPQWAYKNIVTVGIRLKDFDWTEQIIHQLKNNLLPGERENVVAYNLAAFYYAKKEYKNALQQLHNVEFTDNSYHLGAKIIQVKSYYETDESEAFFALIEAFRKYVRRNKEMADYRKEANLHFLKIACQIYLLRLKKQTLRKAEYNKKFTKVEKQLKEIAVVANKDWLELILGRL